MRNNFRDYPEAIKAFSDVWNSHHTPGRPGMADAHTMAERTAEILEEALPPAETKKTVIALGILLHVEGGLHGPRAATIHEFYTEAAPLILEVRAMGEALKVEAHTSKGVLQALTAKQIAEHEALFSAVSNEGYPATLKEARDLRGTLLQVRQNRDTSAYIDIGADRLQAMEMDTWRHLVRAVEKRIASDARQPRAPAPGPGVNKPN